MYHLAAKAQILNNLNAYPLISALFIAKNTALEHLEDAHDDLTKSETKEQFRQAITEIEKMFDQLIDQAYAQKGSAK